MVVADKIAKDKGEDDTLKEDHNEVAIGNGNNKGNKSINKVENDTSKHNDNKMSNANNEDKGDQSKNRMVDIGVQTTATIENVMDLENRVNDKQGLDICIFAEVITYPFSTTSQRFKF